MSIIIERARPKDAAEILEYLKKIGGETDNLSFGKEGLAFTAEAEANYIAKIENSRDDVMLIAKDDDKIVGTASLARLPRRMAHRGDVSVSVLRAYWNKGIGGRLLAELIDFARNNSFEAIDLQVRSDNLAAIHLYEKFGFEKIGTHPAFFKIDGEAVPCDYMILKIK